MKKSVIDVNGRICTLYADDAPEYVIVQPTGTHEAALLDDEIEYIYHNTDRRFCFVAYPIAEWNRELSPWRARQAYGEDYFGDGAEHTLKDITDNLIPMLQRQVDISDKAKYILGGYSLAGLFSLWSAYQTDIFYAVAACSPSVWIDGWQEYTAHRRPLAQYVYLSLGTKEHKTRNPILQTVKQAVVHQYDQVQRQKIHAVLEWNNGNHFQDYADRMGKAFLWAVKVNEESGMKHEND